MSKIDKYIDKFKNALKKENLNFTEQRYAVLKTLFENDGHYDCEEIVQLISEKKLKTSRATVYSTLDILVKYDFARKLVLLSKSFKVYIYIFYYLKRGHQIGDDKWLVKKDS